MTSPGTCGGCTPVPTSPQNAAYLVNTALAVGLATTVATFGGLGFPGSTAEIVGSDWIPYLGPNANPPPTLNGYAFSTVPGAGGLIDLQAISIDFDTTPALAGDVWALALRTRLYGDVLLAKITIVP